MVLGRRCREITEFRPKNQLFLKNEEDVWLGLSSVVEGSYWKTSRGWVSQLDVVFYLFWYDLFYHGNFKFKAKLGLGAVLLTFSYHSDSKMGHAINYLLTGCSCRTRKYKPLVFQTARAWKPWACISWYGPCTQLVNSKYQEPWIWRVELPLVRI